MTKGYSVPHHTLARIQSIEPTRLNMACGFAIGATEVGTWKKAHRLTTKCNIAHFAGQKSSKKFHWREKNEYSHLYCTDENIQAYNADEKHADFVEIVELEENSLAYYFYNLKTKHIQDEADDLRDLMNDLEDIAERIDSRLNKFDRWFESERGDRE